MEPPGRRLRGHEERAIGFELVGDQTSPSKKYYCFIVPHVVRGLDFTARVRGAIDNREEFCRFPPPSRKSGGAGPSPIPRTISSVAFFHPIHLIVQQVYQFRYMLNVAELVDHLQAPFDPLVAHLSPRHQ